MAGTNDGLWRDEGTLVMHRSASLPELCVVSGTPATRRIVRKLTWYPPWVGATLLLVFAGIGILPFLVLAAIFTKRATITLPLSDAAFSKRRMKLLLAWLFALGCVGAIVFGFVRAAATGSNAIVWFSAAAGGFVGLVIAAAIGQRVANVVRVKEISDTHVALDGVHAALLEPLPPVSLRQTPSRMWEWTLPGGERVLARLDADGTESVWLGQRLVSRGAKPEGHELALAGGAYRGGGVARVIFRREMAAASLELDGATLAPSPFAAAPPLPVRRGRVAAIAVGALAAAVAVAAIGAACSEDGKSELTCASSRADFVPPQAPTQIRPSPTIRNGRVYYPPPPPPKPPTVIVENGSLVWARPRTCKTACNVQGGRVSCD